MEKIFSIITSLAAVAFVFPLTIMPDAVNNCADTSYVFITNDSDIAEVQAENLVATTFAKAEFCRVVDRQIELYF